MEEIGILDMDNMKNMYLRTSKKAAFMGGTSAYLQTDNRLSIYDCLCGLMLPSGNDAAILLATEFGRFLFLTGDKNKRDLLPLVSNKGKIGIYQNDSKSTEEAIQMSFMFPNKGHEDYIKSFLLEMNRQCTRLRLKNCRFMNPHGMSFDKNHASASDILCLMNYAMKYPVLCEIMGKRFHCCEIITYDFDKRMYRWDNTNKLTNKYFVASKTGVTEEAGPCLVSVLRVGPYECKGVLINCKNTEIRWKEMSTILLW